MTCTETKPLLSPYLDGAVTGKEMRAIREHLEACAACSSHYATLRQTQSLVSGLGRKKAPPELALRLRVALSHEAAKPTAWQAWKIRFENAARGMMVPATAGVLSAIVMFGLLIGFFAVPASLQASNNDVPTMLYTPPQLKFSPFEFELGSSADAVVVEAYVDADGRVQDYRILSAPEDAHQIMPQLNNMLIFTVFQPATSFGQPVAGRAVLSFAKINVKG